MFWTARREDLGLVKVMMKSSAYSLILCSVSPILTPVIDVAQRMDCTSGSMIMAKIKGESGHPCLIMNGSDTIPDVQTRAVGEE